MKRIVKRSALAAVLAAFVLYGVLCVQSIREARNVRHAPTSRGIAALLVGESPHKVLGRYVLLRSGSPVYHCDLLPLINASGISDNPWNRRVVGNFLASSPIECLAEHIQGYRLQPTQALEATALKALHDGHFAFVPVLSRTSSGKEALEAWVRREFPKLERDLQIQAVFYLLLIQPDMFDSAFTALNLDKDESEWFFTDVPVSSVGPSFLAYARQAIEKRSSTLVKFTPMFAALLNDASMAEEATPLAHALLPQVEPQRIPAFLGVEECDADFTQHGNECGPDVILSSTEQLYVDAFNRARAEPAAAATIYHVIAHTFPERAQVLTAEICNAQDSTVAKSVAVLANRHDVLPGCVDKAFTGEARRITRFRSLEQYATGSAAADTYGLLAGHDVLTVGKRWPPHYGIKPPTTEDAAQWDEFIKKYPWYSAVDDAYYRLAYSHLLANRPNDALAVVERYGALELPDDDSSPYLQYLALVVRAERGEPVSADQLIGMRDSLPDRTLYESNARQPIEHAIDLIDWLIRNRSSISGSVPQEENLFSMRANLELARRRCVDFQKCDVPPAIAAFTAVQWSVPERLAATLEAVLRPRADRRP